jgi:hypothetical protein
LISIFTPAGRSMVCDATMVFMTPPLPSSRSNSRTQPQGRRCRDHKENGKRERGSKRRLPFNLFVRAYVSLFALPN